MNQIYAREGLHPATKVLIVLGIIAVLVGGWFGYWALARANTAEQYKVNTGTQQYQSSVISQERDYVHDYDRTVDTAQKQQIAQTFCDRYTELTQIPNDLSLAHARLCND